MKKYTDDEIISTCRSILGLPDDLSKFTIAPLVAISLAKDLARVMLEQASRRKLEAAQARKPKPDPKPYGFTSEDAIEAWERN